MIKNLTGLTELSLTLEGLTNADALTNLVNLEKLEMTYCSIDNIDFVKGLPKLTNLSIKDNNKQYDLSPIEGTTILTDLYVNEADILNPEIMDGLFSKTGLERFSYS